MLSKADILLRIELLIPDPGYDVNIYDVIGVLRALAEALPDEAEDV